LWNLFGKTEALNKVRVIDYALYSEEYFDRTGLEMNEMTNVCKNNNATETPQILSWSTEAVISSTAIFIYIVWVKILFYIMPKIIRY